jgi:hypothetical protein
VSLTNYQTGEDLEGDVSERLANALNDAASNSETGAVYAYRDDAGVWQYVSPMDREDEERRGRAVLAVFSGDPIED